MRASLLVLAMALPLAGCSLFGRSAGTTIAPHVVFLAPGGCGFAVAKVHRDGYALMSSLEESYVLQLGDVLEGPAREGESIFRRFPPAARNAEWSEGLEVPIDVLATGLELGDAHRGSTPSASWRARRCRARQAPRSSSRHAASGAAGAEAGARGAAPDSRPLRGPALASGG